MRYPDKIYIPLPAAILDLSPWRQMSWTQMFRLFRAELFNPVRVLTATSGLFSHDGVCNGSVAPLLGVQNTLKCFHLGTFLYIWQQWLLIWTSINGFLTLSWQLIYFSLCGSLDTHNRPPTKFSSIYVEFVVDLDFNIWYLSFIMSADLL